MAPLKSNDITGNIAAVVDFLSADAELRLSPAEIDNQIREERDAWDCCEKLF